ncbi:hypothetical protein BO85DRAFT_472479 [Aspergillus piperis CBS 112811]|uniref:Uncharacterized protein n=1 Tax=Aspergillus piperis CBS 112811 TaxID=1448313 RepID=A0A8G1QTK3_9EURO|nr:hypothetical protein BO85DRAFT_472479 [Aspergillus piperis CBS 112811]RAH52666.1 hypothetical protein BO85DRAFT_472479 [Aspergillus piperis CBS 112811]
MPSPATTSPFGFMAQYQAKGLITDEGFKAFRDAYTGHLPDVKMYVAEEDGMHVFYYNAGLETGGAVFRTNRADAVASILHMVQDNGGEIEKVSIDVLGARAGLEVQTLNDYFPVYAGADATAHLVDLKGGPCYGTLGVGVDTELGYRDQSVGCKVLGCGMRVGRVCEISAFGSKIGIDWGKLF